MIRRSVQAGCVVLALLASIAPSHAETAVETASRWGLIGTWRASCSTPVHLFDPEETYIVRGTTLFLESNSGNSQQTLTLEHAAIQADGKIELTLFDANRWRRKNILERNHEGRIRLLTSWDVVSGTFYARDGRMANGMREFRWQGRCR